MLLDFDVREQQGMDFFSNMGSYFGQEYLFKVNMP